MTASRARGASRSPALTGAQGSGVPLGERIRRRRKSAGIPLAELSRRTGLTLSTLSRIETGKISATFDRIQEVALALGIGISELLAGPDDLPDAKRSRRAVSTSSQRTTVRSAHYEYQSLCWEFSDQAMFPVIARLLHRDLASFGELVRHPGQEFIYVLKGRARIVTEHYEEILLEAGETLYIDSMMGHAYLNALPRGETVILGCATINRRASDSRSDW